MQIPEKLKYTTSHEWVKVDGNIATIGITDHAQTELGDIVYVELPEAGADFETGKEFGTIEAVKTVAELYAPLAGKVTEVNSALQDDASAINSDPYGEGWILKMEVAGDLPGDLLDAAGYKAHIGK